MSWRRDRSHYWELRREGRCVLCACKMRSGETRVYCQKCADKKNEKRNAERRAWYTAGLCRTCGKTVEEGHTRCQSCLMDKRKAKQRAKGARTDRFTTSTQQNRS